MTIHTWAKLCTLRCPVRVLHPGRWDGHPQRPGGSNVPDRQAAGPRVRPQPVPTTTEDAVPALHDLPATDLLTAVGSGKATVTDVVTSCLQRVAEREPVVRAFVTLEVELVHKQASALDDERERGPLHGLPVGVKD